MVAVKIWKNLSPAPIMPSLTIILVKNISVTAKPNHDNNKHQYTWNRITVLSYCIADCAARPIRNPRGLPCNVIDNFGHVVESKLIHGAADVFSN